MKLSKSRFQLLYVDMPFLSLQHVLPTTGVSPTSWVTMLFLLMAPILATLPLNAEPFSEAPWTEPSYQYRIPLETNSESTGWQRIPLSDQQLVDTINASEKFQYDPLFIAYNQIKLVEVDAEGRPLASSDEAGYYLIPEGENLAAGILEVETKDKAPIKVEPNRFYIMDYQSSGGGISPATGYEQVHEPGHPLRKTNFRSSYFPPLNPLSSTAHEVLFVPDREEMDLLVKGSQVTKISDISVREAKISLLANVKTSGPKRWFLYYQPMGSHHLEIPAKRHDSLPDTELSVTKIGPAQHHDPGLHYSLVSQDAFDVAYADSTIKLIPDLPLPEESQKSIALYAAANESISFQIFITPKTKGNFQSAAASDFVAGEHAISSDAIRIKRIEYVKIKKPSYIAPSRYLGDIGDPLLPVAPRDLTPKDGPLGLWITLTVPPHTAPGDYQGSLSLTLNDSTVKIPVSLEVMDFELAEFSPLQTNMGGQFFTKIINFKGTQMQTISHFHGVKSEKDLRQLANAYFEVMADNKFNPKTVALLTEIGLNWTPPPEGYNVDAKDNFFTLKDWDFTAFNAQLRHFIDEKKVNSFSIYHTNPTVSNIFTQLPGKRLAEPYPYPGHVTMAWQTFRETTSVAYGKIPESRKDSVIQVTEKQWDNLVLQYFRAIAKNLEENGWLDKATILIDETSNSEQLEHFLKLLRSDPLTAQIQTIACVQGTGEITEATPGGEPGSRFRELLGSFVPEMDENYDRWMDYYFDDYGIARERDKLWFYIVATSRHAIDTPGLNNRVIGMDIFRRGGSGLLYWESFHWDNPYGDANTPEKHPPGGNPWIDPYLRHSNGALAFFYPPMRDNTLPSQPDFSITPSLRMEAFRQANTDYEYALMLEDLVAQAKEQGLDVSKAETIFAQIGDFFGGNTSWSQNAWWYLDIRRRMAEEIVSLQSQLKAETPGNLKAGKPEGKAKKQNAGYSQIEQPPFNGSPFRLSPQNPHPRLS